MTVKTFLGFALSFAVIVSCTKEELEQGKTGNIDRELPSLVSPETPEGFDTSIFDLLNLDYPGLGKVKSAFESGNDGLAAAELLDYYRNRTNVVNPFIDLVAPSFTASEKNIADQALETRFYVRNFYESTDPVTGAEIYYSFADKDLGINWEYVPDGVTSQEFRYQKHRHQWMEPQAKLYRATRDERYFENWQTVYQSWLDFYEFPGENPGFPPPGGAENDVDYQWKGLQVAERVLSQINILSYYMCSDNLTPAWLSTVLTMFAHQVELIRNTYYPDSNIRVTQLQAVATAGILMPEFKNAEIWASEACNLLKQELDNQFFDDGVLVELDPSYHIAAIADFIDISTLADYNNCRNLIGDDFLTKLHKAMTFVADITYPDYSIDNWNDTRASSYSKSVLVKNFNLYSQTFPEDQYFKWMATFGKQGAHPESLTAQYPEGGYFMMRNGWTTSSTMIVVKNNANPRKAWHCQADNGTFSFWHKGRNFLPDAGVYSYNTDANRRDYAATANHNTVTLGTSSYASGAQDVELLKSGTVDGNEILVTRHLIKDGIQHRRAFVFVDREYLVVIDDVYGGAQNTVTVNMHLTTTEEAPTSISEGQAVTTFSDGKNLFVKTFAEYDNGIATTSVNSKVSNKLDYVSGKRAGYRLSNVKDADKAARFVTVLYPFGNTVPEITAEFTDNSETGNGAYHSEGSAVKVTIDGTAHYISYSL